MNYGSDFMNALFEEDTPFAPMSETYYVKENLFQGSSVVDINGNTIMETMPHAGGGETAHFGYGETAHVRDNVEGGITVDFQGIENDITSRPSIFGQENYYQNGEHIGTMQPNFTGDGVDFVAPSGGTIFSSSNNSVIGDSQMTIDSSFVNSGNYGTDFDLQNHFSEIETVASQFSSADLGTAMDGTDALDVLEFL
ncbi:hypothetical protein [Aquibacillus rhizosphaerae]|uniref:Uncharacterized protein n=1 Tax=Aquibacillus rhizosphaerae TaxID=3051431 RepID=A0ABT7L209_9BACI|nr:hypothetical protein [Aquibacillus sp. LR5S19]MDL4839242.1 hypothetical protein [Aquibacillus sp. LR5S19]